ncbi:MAG: alpha/beta hydrolase [Bacteroidota bacterium]
MKRVYWLIGTIIGGGVVSCGQFRTSNEKLYQQFEAEPVSLQIKEYQFEEHAIRYLETGSDDKPLVLFVHGAPGSADAFVDFLKDSVLTKNAHLISVDRPGYGYSGFGNTMVSIERQAAALKYLLEQNKAQPKPILVGHSFGGPIVARIAMDYPDLVGALILAAPAVDPANEKIWWVSYPADWKLFRWMVPRSWRVTNDEKLAHIEELKKMQPLWSKVIVPTTIIHGEKDKLVPIENAYFAQEQLVNAPVTAVFEPEMNHLIPWNRPDLIKDAILGYLEEENNGIEN